MVPARLAAPLDEFLDGEETALDLRGGRAPADLHSLRPCTRLVSINLSGNPALTSLDGLQHCVALWVVDASGCALSGVEPLVALGALGELHLAHNQLTLSAVLQLRPMPIGRLSLQGNPLLTDDGLRAEMADAVGDAADDGDSRLLRSFLVDALSGVIALDDSFVTSARAPTDAPQTPRRRVLTAASSPRPHRRVLTASSPLVCTQPPSATSAGRTLPPPRLDRPCVVGCSPPATTAPATAPATRSPRPPPPP